MKLRGSRLLTIFGPSKSIPQLQSDLSTTTQGSQPLKNYYAFVKEKMIDLLIKSTQGLQRAQYEEVETQIRTSARDAFINGLKSELSATLLTVRPDSLEAAFQHAKERANLIGNETQPNNMSELVTMLQEKLTNMEQKIDTKLANNNHRNPRQNLPYSASTQQPNSNYKKYNQYKYCNHHKSKSHSTEECRYLSKNNTKIPQASNQQAVLYPTMYTPNTYFMQHSYPQQFQQQPATNLYTQPIYNMNPQYTALHPSMMNHLNYPHMTSSHPGSTHPGLSTPKALMPPTNTSNR